MPKVVGTSSNSVDRSTRSRALSARKCCACQCQQGTQEPSRVGRKRTYVKPSKSNAQVSKPRKVGPDVLPSVARAKSSVKLRPDALKHKSPKTEKTVSAETSAALEDEATSVQQKIEDIKKIAQVSRTRRIKKQPALPHPNNSMTLTTATPRQIWRKKADLTPRASTANPSTNKLKMAAVPKEELTMMPEDLLYDDIGGEYHITWDGFDEMDYKIGEVCSFCEVDLAFAPVDNDNETEFSTLPVVAMLPCGHAFHVDCLDQAELGVNQGDPICVFCESTL